MSDYITYVGVDVSSKHLDVHDLKTGQSWRLANTGQAAAQLMARYAPGSTAFACEATGGYERILMHAADAAGQSLWRLHPADVHAYSRLKGQRAKTDRIDACKIAEALRLVSDRRPASVAAPETALLRDLLTLRRQAVETITVWRGHLTRLTKDAKDIAVAQLAQAEALKEDLTRRIQKLLSAERALKRKAQRILSLPGAGPMLSAHLIAYMPELGQISAKQAASLIGVAPHPRQSGRDVSKGRCSGGRPILRRILYMAALSTIRADKAPFAGFYKRLRQNGKPHKVAMVAVMRKMIRALNQLIKENREWRTA